MMPTQYARVAINCYSGFVQWQNILWFEIIGAFSSTFDIAAAAAAIDTEYEGAYRAIMGADTYYAGTDLRVNNNGVSGDSSTDLAALGGGISGGAPPEVAAIVRLQTATPGKPGRGRVYISGGSVDQFVGGRIDAGVITAWNTLAAKFKTGLLIQTQSWVPCLLSRKADPTGTLLPIVSTTVDLILGTQRRRRPSR